MPLHLAAKALIHSVVVSQAKVESVIAVSTPAFGGSVRVLWNAGFLKVC